MSYPKGYTPKDNNPWGKERSEFFFRNRKWYFTVSIIISVILSYILGELGVPSLLGYSKMFSSFPLSFISILVSFGFFLFLLPSLLIAKLHARLTGNKEYA